MRRAAVATLVAGIVASGCTGGGGSSGSVPPSPATSSRATASLVATFRGTSATTTRPFTAATGWGVRLEIRPASVHGGGRMGDPVRDPYGVGVQCFRPRRDRCGGRDPDRAAGSGRWLQL